jgi:hypothetical protein
MRNFLTTCDIARLTRYSRAQIWNLAKLDKIPGRRVKYSRKRYRYVDSTEIRMWCEVKRRQPSDDELAVAFIEALVRAVIARDYRADPEKFIFREICAQLDASKDPQQLLEKWERAMVDRRPKGLPHVDLARLGSEVVVEIRRHLLDSKNPEELIEKWARAVWDQRFEDLPHVP